MNKENKYKPVRFFGETLGLYPLNLRFKQAKIAIFGEEDVPRSKAGLSSLKQLRPKQAFYLWRGKPYLKRKVLISNLYNHSQTSIWEGWSVAKNQVCDFRGEQLTYNSHNGTDFAIPIGTIVRTAAPGEVVKIVSEFHRGGLKIFIDHGNGVMTCTAHLARSLVKIGDVLQRGAAIAISGYSGLDALITFPFGIPHIHFNVWLNAEPVDPFARDDGEASLWLLDNFPQPIPLDTKSIEFVPSDYETEKIEQGISNCATASSRSRIKSISSTKLCAAELIAEMNYYPTRFKERVSPYKFKHDRSPLLDLPFSREDFDEVVFIDKI